LTGCSVEKWLIEECRSYGLVEAAGNDAVKLTGAPQA
jgi:hypothetical protein